MSKKVEERIIEIALEIAKDGKGALFVIGDIKYKKLFESLVSDKTSVLDKKNFRLIKHLAQMDGAVIVDRRGTIKEYGAMIESKKSYSGYGTRHAAAISASIKNNISILCSEEDKKVKVFKNQKLFLQLDPLTKDVNKSVPIAVSMLEAVGAGTLGTIGASAFLPTIGVSFIPGLLIFGGSYALIRKLFDKIM
jgi:DNA integrity scanning protein DisA with diadenylate cyclase activity